MGDEYCKECGHKIIIFYSEKDKSHIGKCTGCTCIYDLVFRKRKAKDVVA